MKKSPLNINFPLKISEEMQENIEKSYQLHNDILVKNGAKPISLAEFVRQIISEKLTTIEEGSKNLKFLFAFADMLSDESTLIDPFVFAPKEKLSPVMHFSSITFSNPFIGEEKHSETKTLTTEKYKLFKEKYFKSILPEQEEEMLDSIEQTEASYKFDLTFFHKDDKHYFVYECFDIFEKNEVLFHLRRGKYVEIKEFNNLKFVKNTFPYLRATDSMEIVNRNPKEIIDDSKDEKVLSFSKLFD